MDLKSAFQHVCVTLESATHLGFSFDDVCYGNPLVDLRLPFGSRSSPFLFNVGAEMTEWIAHSVGVGNAPAGLQHYLDGNWGCRSAEAEAVADYTRFREVLDQLGWCIAPDKSAPPSQVLVVLGIELDTVHSTARIPDGKRNEARRRVADCLERRAVTRLLEEQTTSLLAFVARITPAGRTFCRRLYDAIQDAHRFRPRRLSSAARQDLLWWRDFLSGWSGSSYFSLPRARDTVLSDACGVGGLGGWIGPALGDAPPPPASAIAAFEHDAPTSPPRQGNPLQKRPTRSCLPWQLGSTTSVTERWRYGPTIKLLHTSPST